MSCQSLCCNVLLSFCHYLASFCKTKIKYYYETWMCLQFDTFVSIFENFVFDDKRKHFFQYGLQHFENSVNMQPSRNGLCGKKKKKKEKFTYSR